MESGKEWGSMGSASWKGVGVEVRCMYKVSVTQDDHAWLFSFVLKVGGPYGALISGWAGVSGGEMSGFSQILRKKYV